MNLLFKIVEILPETDQIVVKFCRQNALKCIDDYPSVAIDTLNLDFSNYDNFKYSLISQGISIIRNQLKEDPILSCNNLDEDTNSVILNDNLNKIIGVDLDEILYGTHIFQSML